MTVFHDIVFDVFEVFGGFEVFDALMCFDVFDVFHHCVCCVSMGLIHAFELF